MPATDRGLSARDRWTKARGPAGNLWRVRILLSPSETKSGGGCGSPLDLAALSRYRRPRRAARGGRAGHDVYRRRGPGAAGTGLSDALAGEVSLDAEL